MVKLVADRYSEDLIRAKKYLDQLIKENRLSGILEKVADISTRDIIQMYEEHGYIYTGARRNILLCECLMHFQRRTDNG